MSKTTAALAYDRPTPRTSRMEGTMEPPRDGESDAPADGTLAKIIPLRRRGLGGEELEADAHERDVDVFEAPAEPQPPEGYSVWERPTAELIRRPLLPEPSARGRLRARASLLARERWRVALAAQVATLAALALLALGRGAAHHAYASRNGQSALLGLGAAGPAGEGSPPKASPKVKRSGSAAATRRTRAGARHPPRSTAAARAPGASSSSSVARTGHADAASSSAATASPPSPRTSETARAPVASATSREFGFEN